MDEVRDESSCNASGSKYMAQTRSPSDGEDIRWYFSKAPLPQSAPAASVPATEVVGKNDYFRFSMRDSLALEAKFLEQEEELVSTWWMEYAESSEGPTGESGRALLKPMSDNAERTAGGMSLSGAAVDSGSVSEQFDSSQYLEDEEDMIGVPVKGGLFEVDLWKRRCFPVYWRGDQRRVLRGHWFARKGGLDWLPLREDISEQLEFAYRSKIWHRRTFQPSGQFAARVDLQGATQGLHALFIGEDATWEAWLGIDLSGISMVLGMRGTGIKLRRGFASPESSQLTQNELQQRKEEEMDDYCSQVPVRHLVFMVHGIGQRLQNANLVDDVGTFRHIAASLAEQHLTAYQRNSQRILFIPCQWRRGLKLKGEDAVENCTLEGVRALRTMLSATVHDVLYYMSPVYCQEIMDSVSGQLNRLYRRFVKRNPGYNGRVSIYGHSLGSVLSYDILCHQANLSAAVPMQQIVSNICQSEEELKSGNVSGTDNDANLDLDRCDEKPNVKGNIGCIILTEAVTQNNDFNNNESDLQELDALRAEVNTLKAKLRALVEGEKKPFSEDSLHYIGQCNKIGQNVGTKNNLTADTIDPEEGDPECEGGNGEGSTSALTDMFAVHDGRTDLRNSVEDPNKKEQTPVSTGDEEVRANSTEKSGPRKRYTPYITFTKLDFQVDTFFAVGSPVGVFLALRNVRLGMGGGKEYWNDEAIEEEMPACLRMFNIFHPYDPVAYRIEPLVCKDYINKRPVFIPYHKGGKRIHIGMQEFGEDLSSRSKAFVKSLGVARTRMVGVFSTRSSESEVQQSEKGVKERSYGSFAMERLTGDPEGRIDYMLQDATFEHQYIQAISSHTSYWRDPDTVLFILKQLYHQIPPQPPKPKEFEATCEITEYVSVEQMPLGQSEPHDLDEEGAAFTFSSKQELTQIISMFKK